MIISIGWILVNLAVIVLAILILYWLLNMLFQITVPDNIQRLVWGIVLAIGVLWIVSVLFGATWVPYYRP